MCQVPNLHHCHHKEHFAHIPHKTSLCVIAGTIFVLVDKWIIPFQWHTFDCSAILNDTLRNNCACDETLLMRNNCARDAQLISHVFDH